MIFIREEPNILGLIPIFTEMHATSHVSVLSSYETHASCMVYDYTLLDFIERLVQYKIRPKVSEEPPDF